MMQRAALSAGISIAWIFIALATCAIVVMIAGAAPLSVAQALIHGATGTQYNISNTFVQTIPLLITALAVVIAFRAEMFNIGVEGQFLLGAVLACWAGQLAVPGPDASFPRRTNRAQQPHHEFHRRSSRRLDGPRPIAGSYPRVSSIGPHTSSGGAPQNHPRVTAPYWNLDRRRVSHFV
jgi:hypothetical protein